MFNQHYSSTIWWYPLKTKLTYRNTEADNKTQNATSEGKYASQITTAMQLEEMKITMCFDDGNGGAVMEVCLHCLSTLPIGKSSGILCGLCPAASKKQYWSRTISIQTKLKVSKTFILSHLLPFPDVDFYGFFTKV